MDACSLSQGPGVQGFNSGLGGAREPRGSTRHSRGPARVRRVQAFRAPTHTHLDIAPPTLSPPPPPQMVPVSLPGMGNPGLLFLASPRVSNLNDMRVRPGV